MKAHIIIKIYDNNTSVVQSVYSSYQKALDALNKDLAIYSLDGYDVSLDTYGDVREWYVNKQRDSDRYYKLWFRIESKPIL